MSGRVIIAGPRDLHVDDGTITAALDAADFECLEVVSGAASGVDRAAERWALRYNFGLRRFFPKWKEHGKAAGPIRNREMAGYADALLIIRRRGETTRGTTSMIREAAARKLPIYVHEVET